MTELPEQPAMPESPVARDDRLDAARKRAEEIQGFYVHLIVYVVVNAGLFTINALSRGDSGVWWFYWPLAGWGIGLLIHAATTYLGVFSEDWKERKARQLFEREHHGSARA
ncbi:MAG TPA: 2TM domain-containing protein [Actinomycetota bacterium]|jgi:protein-S-isoprenylcysteine O-methyltransferase Ste14|nr:2TM domain-containing protein [Actinomycetota bacterium]